jgi:hypothetical protein
MIHWGLASWLSGFLSPVGCSQHLAGHLLALVLLRVGSLITSFDTLVTQQGRIWPSTVIWFGKHGSLICKGSPQQSSMIVNCGIDLVMRRSGVRFPEAALRSFGLTSALFGRILEGQLGLV